MGNDVNDQPRAFLLLCFVHYEVTKLSSFFLPSKYTLARYLGKMRCFFEHSLFRLNFNRNVKKCFLILFLIAQRVELQNNSRKAVFLRYK